MKRLQYEKNIQPILSEARNGIYNELVPKHQEAVEGDLFKQRMYKCKLWHLSKSTDSCRMTDSYHSINYNNGDIHHLGRYIIASLVKGLQNTIFTHLRFRSRQAKIT